MIPDVVERARTQKHNPLGQLQSVNLNSVLMLQDVVEQERTEERQSALLVATYEH